MYLYPENLTARPMLWLWTLRDVAWIGTGLLLSVLALTQTGSMIPLVITAALAFLCIRHGGISMLDFLRYAAAFFSMAAKSYFMLFSPSYDELSMTNKKVPDRLCGQGRENVIPPCFGRGSLRSPHRLLQ